MRGEGDQISVLVPKDAFFIINLNTGIWELHEMEGVNGGLCVFAPQ